MKIDDDMLNYEISKCLPQSASNATENVHEKHLADEQRVEGRQVQEQDTIVNLSRESKEAQHIKEIIASEPDIREDKVSELKERIESGSYRIDRDGIADRLVDAFLDEIF